MEANKTLTFDLMFERDQSGITHFSLYLPTKGLFVVLRLVLQLSHASAAH